MVGWLVGCWMLDGWLEKAELKPTQPSLAGAWLSLAIFVIWDLKDNDQVKKI